MFAFARSAARLALLLFALGSASHAATVYVEEDRVIPRQSACYYYPCYTVDPILLDMDGDGADDVWMRVYSYSGSSSSGSNLTIQGQNGTLIDAGPKRGAGDLIGYGLSFQSNVVPASYRYSRRSSWRGGSSTSYGGTWGDNTPTLRQGFIGVALTGDRYGWLELEINGNGFGRLLAWGYETDADVAIAAGAAQTFVARAEAPTVPLPATGVLLLAGLAAFGIGRRAG
jgi:hypothetical protein